MRVLPLLPLVVVAVLVAGCSSSDDEVGSTPSPSTSSSASAPATPATPTTPTLVRDGEPFSGCVKGSGSGTRRVAVWQPTFTAQGGDIRIRTARITGRGVTLFDSQAVLVPAGTRTVSSQLPWPVEDVGLPEGASTGDLTSLRGMTVPEGSTVLPVLGVSFAPSTQRRGAKLADLVLTYAAVDGGGRATVEAAVDVSYPNPGKRC